MSSARKIKRKKELALRKKSKKVMKEVTKNLDNMPKQCSSCGVKLDATVSENLDQWRIQIYETGRVALTCPDCQTNDTEVQESNS